LFEIRVLVQVLAIKANKAKKNKMGETLGWFSKKTLDSFYNIKSKSQSKFSSMWDFSHKTHTWISSNDIL